MLNNKIKKPLKMVVAFFSFGSVWYIFSFMQTAAKSNTLFEAVESEKLSIIGFCLCMLFVVGYLKKNILAWWVAISTCPIMFVASTIIKERTIGVPNIAAFVFINYLIFIYLLPRYTTYKSYIENDNQLAGFIDLPETKSDLQANDSSSDIGNPMKAIFAASVILGIFELSYLYPIVKIPENHLLILISFSHHTILFIILLAILFFYRRKSILAWWIAMIHIPFIWLLYNLFNPFNIVQSAITISIFVFMAGYLIIKYKSYRAYISIENNSKGL